MTGNLLRGSLTFCVKAMEKPANPAYDPAQHPHGDAAVSSEHIDIMTTENAKSGDSRVDQVIAGEYVLGVLPPEDRQKVEARMMLDRNFAAMVDHWRSNLLTVETMPKPTRRAPRKASPFAEPAAVRGKAPRPQAPGGNGVIWHSASFWRGVAGIATIGLVAAGLGQSGVFSAPVAKPVSTRLGLAGSDLALTARFDADSGHLRLSPVAATAGAPGPAVAKSLQLWLTEDGHPPVSLGVVSGADAGTGDIVVPKAVRGRIKAGTNLALTLEPAGGSPTGLPTGSTLSQGATGQ